MLHLRTPLHISFSTGCREAYNWLQGCSCPCQQLLRGAWLWRLSDKCACHECCQGSHPVRFAPLRPRQPVPARLDVGHMLLGQLAGHPCHDLKVIGCVGLACTAKQTQMMPLSLEVLVTPVSCSSISVHSVVSC